MYKDFGQFHFEWFQIIRDSSYFCWHCSGGHPWGRVGAVALWTEHKICTYLGFRNKKIRPAVQELVLKGNFSEKLKI